MTMAILFGVFAIGLIGFHILERTAPVIPGLRHGPRRPDYIAEFTAAIVDGPVMDSLTKIASYSLIVLIPQYSHRVGDLPWWGQLGLFFIINDFGRYWLHRWYHQFDFLWRIHRVHHTVREMDALSTFRVHVLEGVFKYGLLVLPFHLFGIDRWVLVTYSSLDILKGFWHHANLRNYIGPLNYILNSPELHWWHHAVEGRGQRSNYGSVLSIWDWLFGTAYWPRGQWPERVGVAGLEHFPNSYPGMLTSVRYTDEQAVKIYAAESAAAPAPAERGEVVQEKLETARESVPVGR